jgi:hypothetical protein
VSVQGAELLEDRTASGRYREGHGTSPACRKAKATNHRDLLVGVSGRSAMGRRFRDLVSTIGVDQGGLDHLSEIRLQLIRRFAAIVVLSERQEVKIAQGEEVDVAQFTTMANSLARYAVLLGLDRVPRTVDPPLSFNEPSVHVAAPSPAVSDHDGDE